MKVARTVPALRRVLDRFRHPVGFVPTMGDLHEGHLALIRRSKRENKVTVVSIFVNPAQFNSRQDFKKYHRDLRKDLTLARKAGADMIFAPAASGLYPEGFQTWVEPGPLAKPLCGAFRPGHFRGVATVVLKLFNAVRPDNAYFGLKDYQQFRVVERMALDLSLPLRVVPCATVREKDGLAMSSRNRRLSPEERGRAKRIYAGLKAARALLRKGRGVDAAALGREFRRELKPAKQDRVEYFEAVDARTLERPRALKPPLLLAAAVWVGKTRLIDNLTI